MPENCEKAGKIAKKTEKVCKTMQIISFLFMPSHISIFIHALSRKNMCAKAITYSSYMKS